MPRKMNNDQVVFNPTSPEFTIANQINPLQSYLLYLNNDADQFPIGALPEKLRNAILEVWTQVQAPLPMVVSSALSAMSMACQHLVDVQRTPNLTSPCSLFFLTIAESGERKTTCDGYFTKSIRAFDEKQRQEAEAAQKAYQIDHQLWKERTRALKNKLSKAVRDQEGEEEAQQALREHLQNETPRPQAIKMLLDDATPIAICKSLYTNWPSVGILSDEAGKLFNTNTFANIGLFNKLWDGASIQVERHRQDDSFSVSNGRMTMSLMVQEKTLIDFFEKQGKLARDNGFLARCLACMPISTQGRRQSINQQHENMPALDFFLGTYGSLIEASVNFGKTTDKKIIMKLTPQAQDRWVQYCKQIESRLLGDLKEIHDASSKAGDMIARLAALLHIFTYRDLNKPIDTDMIDAAEVIIQWYLRSFKHLFGNNSALSQERKDADKLWAWLKAQPLTHYGPYFIRSEIIKRGPLSIRNKASLDAATDLLAREGRIYLEQCLSPRQKPMAVIRINHLAF